MPELKSAFSDLPTREASNVAALDIGSNSFHLVVARIVAGSVQILHRVKQKVRLADGLDENGYLSQEAMQRGLDTLKVIAESIKGFAPDSVRIVATYTLRKALNADEFIRAALDILPYPVEVISGTEEARLIYFGVAHTNHDEGRRLVVDIGGGSTEFIIGEAFEPIKMRSLQMGCVSFTKQFFKRGELKQKYFDRAITAAQQELEMIDSQYKALGWERCLGTSGTIKTIVALAQLQKNAQADGLVTSDDLHMLISACCQAGHIDMLEFDGLSEDRRPVFAAGLAVLSAIFKSLNITQMEFSPAALREGVIYELEDQLTHPDIRERTAQSLATRYDVDTQHASRVLSTTWYIYDQVAETWKIDTKELHNMLGWAALLHEVGLQINTRRVQRHSAYVLENVDMPGFNQEQQNLLATLVGLHRKKIRQVELPHYLQYDDKTVFRLIAILRLGVLLNIKRQDNILPEFLVTAKKDQLILTFPEGWLRQKPIFSADLAREIEWLKVIDIALDCV